MKIEKISDNQIRCTLSKKDLSERQLRISELAYGTEKAKELFHDMMQQASYQFGFEAEDIPLMIEAIPMSGDSLVLVITKVEDPDELDTRFSSFSPEQEDYDFSSEEEEEDVVYADEILNCFNQIHDILGEDEDLTDIISGEESLSPDSSKGIAESTVTTQTNLTKFYAFTTLEEFSHLAEHIVSSYYGLNSLYKDSTTGAYHLVISKSQHTPEEFNRICNIISEYGKAEKTTYASYSYFEEHFQSIIKDKAIQVMGNL
ncbi:MAG: adaptor protein MecA [Acetivibrio sp.]